MKKRILSTLLALAVCLSLLPTAALAEGDSDGNVETHTHCVCGADHTVIDNHITENKVTFAAWEAEDSLPTEAGSYYLSGNVTLTSTWTVSTNITLCLNGYSITENADSVAIQINNSGTLTVIDCTTTPGKITHASGKSGKGVDNAGTFNLYGGEISSHFISIQEYGSAVYSHGGSNCFNMYDGTIRDCSDYYSLTMDSGDTGTIYGGIINVETFTTGTIAGGTFTLGKGQLVEINCYEATGSNRCNYDWGVMTGGIFNGEVLNGSTINGGTFNGSVTNNGAIKNGTFKSKVTNNMDVDGGTFSGTVINNADGYINGGTFSGSVTNKAYGEIYGGTFSGSVTNEKNGVIHNSAYKTVTFLTASSTTPQKVLCGQKATKPADSDVSTWYSGETYEEYSFNAPVTQNMDLYSPQALQAICPHSYITDNGYCPTCNTHYKVYAEGANGAAKYFLTLSDAWIGYSSFTLLDDCTDEAIIPTGKICSVHLNGHSLTSLEVCSGDTELTVTDSAGGGSIGTLTFATTTNLKGGSFGTINGAGYVSLPTGYAFQHTGSDTGMVKRGKYGDTLTNVKVVQCSDHSAGADIKCEYCGREFVAKIDTTC